MSSIADRFSVFTISDADGATYEQIGEAFARLAEYVDTQVEDGRAKATALTRLEEAFLWITQAELRDVNVRSFGELLNLAAEARSL